MKKLLVLAALAAFSCPAALLQIDSSFNVAPNTPVTINVAGPNLPNLVSVTIQLITGTLNSSGTATSNIVGEQTNATFQTQGFQFNLLNFTGQGAFVLGAFTQPNRNESSTTPANFPVVTTNVSSGVFVASNPGALNTNFSYQVDKDILSNIDCDNGNCTVGVSSNVTGTVRFIFDYNPSQGGDIPEPSTMALLGSALVGLGVIARRRKA